MFFFICKWIVIIKVRMVGKQDWHIVKRRLLHLTSWMTTSDHFPLLCTLGIAASSVNLTRVSESVVAFGPSFLVLHSLLALLLGVPISVLELGLGQFSQQGATALWRAIPALRGIAFVKLVCAGLYGACAGVRIAISAAYAVRSAVANFPLSDCSQLTMTENGYFQNNTYGIECAMRTFLKPLADDSFWFSIMCIIIFMVWIVIPLCLYNLDTGIKCSLVTFTTITLVFSIILSVAIGENDWKSILNKWNWSDFASSELWFSATWQALLSNRLGMAYLDTAGGTIYFTSNSKIWSFALVIGNILIGWLGVLFWFSTTSGVERDTSGLGVIVWINDSSVFNERHRVWAFLSYVLVVVTTAASLVSFLYPIFGSLMKTFKYQWRLTALIFLAASMACSMVVFYSGLRVLTFIEQLAVPIIVCVVIFLEVAAFILIYGWRNVRSDLEFMIGNRISISWVPLWVLGAVAASGFGGWELYRVSVDGLWWSEESPLELILLSTLAICMAALVLIWSVVVIVQQDEYDCFLKIKSSFHPSRKWGPVEPILRHLWIQWGSNPHGEELAGQVRTHRQGAVLHDTSRTHSPESSSSKSSLDEYPRKYDYSDSKKSDGSSKISLEEFAEYRGSTLHELRGSKSSSGSESVSSRRETPVSAYSNAGSNIKTTSPSSQEVYYGQIKQMYY